jgi:hypothetical protein
MRSVYLAVAVTIFAAGCAGQKVDQVFKPGATNVFRTEGKDEQANFKAAREHCKGDFEVLKKDELVRDNASIATLEFRCI